GGAAAVGSDDGRAPGGHRPPPGGCLFRATGYALADRAARGCLAVRAKTPANDPAWMNANDLRAHVRAGRRLAGERLGGAADLETAHDPGVDRRDVVDHEGGLPVDRDVVELAGVAEVPATDKDHPGLGVDLEPDRAVLQCAVGRLRGQA